MPIDVSTEVPALIAAAEHPFPRCKRDDIGLFPRHVSARRDNGMRRIGERCRETRIAEFGAGDTGDTELAYRYACSGNE